MINHHAKVLEKQLANGAKYKAHSYTVPGEFLASLLSRLRHDEATIETLHGLLRIERVKEIPTTTNESKP